MFLWTHSFWKFYDWFVHRTKTAQIEFPISFSISIAPSETGLVWVWIEIPRKNRFWKYNLKFIRAMFYPQVWLYSEKGQFNVTVKCKTNISMVTLAIYGVRIIVAKRSNAFIYSHDGWVPFSIAKQLTSGSL